MNDTDDRREQWESAIREQHNGLLPAEVSAIAATTRAMADAEQREAEEKHQAFLQHADQVNNDLMKEVQRYAKGDERPVLWSVYNGMHNRALNAEAENARLRAELEGLKIAHEIEQREGWKREAAIQRVRALAADMRTWCSHRGTATHYTQSIDDALDRPEAGQ